MLTLGYARANLPTVALTSVQAATAAAAAVQINAAVRMLFKDGLWKGTKQAISLTVYAGQVALPRGAQAILSAVVQGSGDAYRYQARYPVTNDWYQWIPNGPGIVTDPPYDVGRFVDRGAGFVTFRTLPSAGTLKLYSELNETAGSFHVRGFSASGKVFTTSGSTKIEGETLAVPTTGGNSATSTTTFSAGDSLYMATKPATNGRLTLYHVSGATETLIGSYEPSERAADYRRYYVPQRETDNDPVIALVKRDAVPVSVDNDEIVPGNLRALELALQACNYERKGEINRSAEFLARAIDDLNREIAGYDSPQSFGVVQLDRISGMGLVENIV